MANPTFKRIKDLSLEKTSVADNDWFVLEDSEDSFKTKKVKAQYIGANIYKNNGTLTGNRTVTGGGYSLTFDNVDTITTKSKYSSSTSLIFDYKDSGNNTRASLSAYGVLQMTPEANGLTGINFRTGDSLRNGIQAPDSSQFLVQGINALNLYAYNGDLTMRTQFGGDIVVKTNDVERMRILNNGRININSNTATSTQVGMKSNGTDYWLLDLQDSSGNTISRFAGGEIELRKITAIGGGNIAGVQLAVYGKQRSINLPTYADNASALAGGLVADDEYKTATGERRIVV